jgi:hypothetical protein
MSETEADDRATAKGIRVTLGGGREAIAIIILLILLSRVGPALRPLLLAAMSAVAVYWFLRTCFRFGKWVGLAGTALLGVTCISAGGVQYEHHLKNEELVEQLRAYNTVTFRRATIFPGSDIIQVSFEGDITDDDISTVASLPQFENITHVFIKQCAASDNALETLDGFQKLAYVFIESDMITDTAIGRFQDRHSTCTLVHYRRD